MTASQTIWAWLRRGDYPPPRPGPDPVCWLCGGATDGRGWPWREAIPETFTNHTLARCPSSRTVCQACAALGSKQTWEAYVADHPEMGLKTGHAMSWRFYSHVVTPRLHACPTRAQWRTWLLDPPEPPFVFVVAESGQKHLLFRATISHSRERYAVQFEERSLMVRRADLTACLEAVEALYGLGFTKQSIVTGGYHSGQLGKAELRWYSAERQVAPYRQNAHGLLLLAAHVAQRAESETGGE